jgi:hypothetical protein
MGIFNCLVSLCLLNLITLNPLGYGTPRQTRFPIKNRRFLIATGKAGENSP